MTHCAQCHTRLQGHGCWVHIEFQFSENCCESSSGGFWNLLRAGESLEDRHGRIEREERIERGEPDDRRQVKAPASYAAPGNPDRRPARRPTARQAPAPNERPGALRILMAAAGRASGPQKFSSLQSESNVSRARHRDRRAARLDSF